MAEPASAPEVRLAYANLGAISYSFYVVGAATAFIAVALSLSETQAGLHTSAMALGMILAGVRGEVLDRWIGVWRTHSLAMVVLVVARVVLARTPTWALPLAAAFGVGLGAGTMFGHITRTLGRGGGVIARLQVTRAAFIAKASQLLAPVAIALGFALGLEWQSVIVPVLAIVLGLFVWGLSLIHI